jgi:hypothetical protein
LAVDELRGIVFSQFCDVLSFHKGMVLLQPMMEDMVARATERTRGISDSSVFFSLLAFFGKECPSEERISHACDNHGLTWKRATPKSHA